MSANADAIHPLIPAGWGRSRLRRFADVLPCMLYEYLMTPDGRRELLFVGSKCRELLELDEEDLLANAALFAELVHKDDLQRLMAEDVAANREGVGFSSEVRIKTRSGHMKWIQLSSRPNPPTANGMVVWSGFMFDTTERKQMEEQVHQLAFNDPLTQLPNRRLLNDRLNQAMSASDRSGFYGALMVLDLDHFKTVNDRHGHLVGDSLLVEAAARLKSSVRVADTVARLGGDEFVVMLGELSLDEVESKRQAGEIAEKIRATLAEPFVLNVQREGHVDVLIQRHCSASIGVTLFRGKSVDEASLIASADAAMYLAKADGRNHFRFCVV